MLVNGRNFAIDIDGQLGPHGFFTTRFVEAASVADAELAAVALIRNLEHIKPLLKNAPDSPPLIHVEEIEEIEDFDPEEPEHGLGWYREDEQQ